MIMQINRCQKPASSTVQKRLLKPTSWRGLQPSLPSRPRAGKIHGKIPRDLMIASPCLFPKNLPFPEISRNVGLVLKICFKNARKLGHWIPKKIPENPKYLEEYHSISSTGPFFAAHCRSFQGQGASLLMSWPSTGPRPARPASPQHLMGKQAHGPMAID